MSEPTEFSEADFDQAVQLSAYALACARAGDWTTAGSTVKEIEERFHGPGIQVMLCGLADTLLIHHGGIPGPDAVVIPQFVDTDGDVTDTDHTPPEVRWAGRFIAAWGARDDDACEALVNSCTDERQWTYNVAALLDVVATTLNMVGAP